MEIIRMNNKKNKTQLYVVYKKPILNLKAHILKGWQNANINQKRQG